MVKYTEESCGYKYLGILETDDWSTDSWRSLQEKYIRSVRNISISKLNGGNMTTTINLRAVSGEYLQIFKKIDRWSNG